MCEKLPYYYFWAYFYHPECHFVDYIFSIESFMSSVNLLRNEVLKVDCVLLYPNSKNSIVLLATSAEENKLILIVKI